MYSKAVVAVEEVEEEVLKEEREVEDSLPALSDISMPESWSWRFL